MKGLEVDIENTQDYFKLKSIENLKGKFIKADVIGIVAPVYIDTLPYPVIDFLDKIEDNFSDILKGKSLFIIGKCNFPESRRVIPMILNCKCFAKEIEMKWLGAMAYGGSVIIIEGRGLEEAGKEGQRMIKALEMATEDIINGEKISKEAIDLFKNYISSYMIKPFTIVANFMLNSRSTIYSFIVTIYHFNS